MSEPRTADVLVVGCGTMGSLALWRLAKRGARVVGIEQFKPGHSLGSGHGESRIIRTTQYEGGGYVPLVREAFGLWRELEEATGASLLTITGGLMIGRPETGVVRGVLRSAQEAGITHETLTPIQVRDRFPQFRLDADEIAVFDESAGVLDPEKAITTAAAEAVRLGAEIVTDTRVSSIEPGSGEVVVRTADREFRGRHAVVCGGAWNPVLLPSVGGQIVVQRKVLTWFRPDQPSLFTPDRFPVFIWERDRVEWYGLPAPDGRTVKIVMHSGNNPVDADTVDRQIHPSDLGPIGEIVERTMVGVSSEVVRSEVCMYSMTRDEHFMVGTPMAMEGVTFLGGFSGHGFKFASVIGDIAADLALTGRTERLIEGFDPNRFDRPGEGGDRQAEDGD